MAAKQTAMDRARLYELAKAELCALSLGNAQAGSLAYLAVTEPLAAAERLRELADGLVAVARRLEGEGLV